MRLEPGTYYVDVLTDGTQSVVRSIPTVKRLSFDKRAPVDHTLKLEITRV